MTESQKNAVTCCGTLGILLVGLCGYFVFLARIHKETKKSQKRIERDSRETNEKINQKLAEYFGGSSINK